MRAFSEKVKHFVENNLKKITKNFLHQEKMPDFRHFNQNEKILFFHLIYQIQIILRFEKR